MSKATWEDTPFYRRLLARLKKDLPPSGGPEFQFPESGQWGGSRGMEANSGLPTLGTALTDGPYQWVADTAYLGSTDELTYDPWDGSPIEDGFARFSQNQAAPNAAAFLMPKRFGLWYMYSDLVLSGPLTASRLRISTSSAWGVAPRLVEVGETYAYIEGLFLTSPAQTNAVYVQLEAVGALATADAALQITYASVFFNPVLLAPVT